ncbi:NUDIX hydrolase [Photobacterium sanctipauli]|uniref:GDP-mannose pyrophosphatase n=1 Tax=Photobacterium sanctipauli TaxID=1342794 RepID=A0A2T3NVM7_9GAMM|nr:NUDIX hydrolase [Photobacterium sanctipauli]PSW20292.1 NUDIX hydrolase [Photobacterium sanctipauli]
MTTKTLCQWKCFSVEQSSQTLPDGRNIEFTTVLHPGAVIIVPVTEQGDLVMVNQYRPAIKDWILEFPAGTLEDSENILACAKRELAEEVQLRAESWTELGELFPVPGFCDEVQYLFLAKSLTTCQGELDDDEIIEVVTLSSAEFLEKVARNEIKDAKTLAAYLKIQAMGLIK